jgi:beta-lactamase superfamily II metal-dependent hydrolase
MDVFTVYAGQGSLASVRAGDEAIIIDAHMPNCEDVTQEQIEQSLDTYLAKKRVRGLILTGLDKDHACPAGVESILSKYQPEWVMYPTYYKDTETATEVFRIIAKHEKRREHSAYPLRRKSVRVDKVDSRHLQDLSACFAFELFSPHMDDMDSSNNSSIVLKVTGLDRTGFGYLVTGDTETGRWDTINRLFGRYLAVPVLAAPHHGALSGMHAGMLLSVNPHTVLISAGVDNSYGHPDGAAIKTYRQVAQRVFSTNADPAGICLLTRRVGDGYETTAVRHFDPVPANV